MRHARARARPSQRDVGSPGRDPRDGRRRSRSRRRHAAGPCSTGGGPRRARAPDRPGPVRAHRCGQSCFQRRVDGACTCTEVASGTTSCRSTCATRALPPDARDPHDRRRIDISSAPPSGAASARGSTVCCQLWNCSSADKGRLRRPSGFGILCSGHRPPRAHLTPRQDRCTSNDMALKERRVSETNSDADHPQR
jgi:hypothetical protein